MGDVVPAVVVFRCLRSLWRWVLLQGNVFLGRGLVVVDLVFFGAKRSLRPETKSVGSWGFVAVVGVVVVGVSRGSGLLGLFVMG